jgi:hypothetical protein
MATSTILRPAFRPKPEVHRRQTESTRQPSADAGSRLRPAMRWLAVPVVGLAVFALLRRRSREPRVQYMSEGWLRTKEHWNLPEF